MNNKDNKVVPIRPGVEINKPTDATARSLGEAEVNLPSHTRRFYAGVEQMMQQTLEKQHFGTLSHLNQRRRTEEPPKNQSTRIEGLNRLGELGKGLKETLDDFDPLAWRHLLTSEPPLNRLDRFRPEQTPPEKRNKVRNACFSGHFPGEEKTCPHCRQARFNTLVTGYYKDKPSLPQLRETVMRMIGAGRYDSEDYQFIMDYLGLPHNIDLDGLNKFYNKIHKIETMSRWADADHRGLFFIRHPLLGEMVPLAYPYLRKSGLVASLIDLDEQLREIYKEAVTMNYEAPARAYGETDVNLYPGRVSHEPFNEMSYLEALALPKLSDIVNKTLEETKANLLRQKDVPATKVGIDIETSLLSRKGPAIVYHTLGGDIFGRRRNVTGKTSLLLAQMASIFARDTTLLVDPGNPFGTVFGGRQERRKRDALYKLSAGYKLKQAKGPKKRGDKNAEQFVKDVKPHPLLKHLIKKTEK